MLKVGIAGFGVVGKRRKEYLDLHPDAQVVALCDQVSESMDGVESSINCHSNFKDLDFKKEIDLFHLNNKEVNSRLIELADNTL